MKYTTSKSQLLTLNIYNDHQSEIFFVDENDTKLTKGIFQK